MASASPGPQAGTPPDEWTHPSEDALDEMDWCDSDPEGDHDICPGCGMCRNCEGCECDNGDDDDWPDEAYDA